MIVCGLDFETTGLDTAKDLVTEVGAVLWDTDAHRPVSVMSTLVYHEGEDGQAPAPLTPEIVRLTGITDDDLKRYGVAPGRAFLDLRAFAQTARYILAHNGKAFDRPMWQSNAARLGLTLPETPWIDTDADIPYPDHIGTRKLTYLCAEHGFVNPFSHRAVFDVLSMLKVVACYDFAEIIAYSEQPTLTVKIIVPPPWEDAAVGNNKAKELGFRYDGASKTWRKQLKENRLGKETNAASPYKVVIVA